MATDIILDSNAKAALIGALVGSIITGIVAFIAIFIEHRLARNREEEKNHLEKIAFVKSIITELGVLKDAYTNVIGYHIECHDETKVLAGGLIYPANSMFTYYDNNANYLGRLDVYYSEKIIKTYVYVKSYFDRLVYYQKMADNYLQGKPLDIEGGYEYLLKEYFKAIKMEHYKVNKMIGENISELQKYLDGLKG
jgi:hypothetical protein